MNSFIKNWLRILTKQTHVVHFAKDTKVIFHPTFATLIPKNVQSSYFLRTIEEIPLFRVMHEFFFPTTVIKWNDSDHSISNAPTAGLERKKKAGAWSPLTFFYPRRVVSYR